MNKTTQLLLRLCLLAIFLTVVFCSTESCSTKQKATNRTNKEERIDIDQNVSEKETRSEKSDCTAVSKSTIDWKAINEALNFKPVDPSKPSTVKFTPEADGGFTYESNNADVNTSKSQEEKREVNYDSIYRSVEFQLRKEYEAKLTAALEALEKSRTSESESSRWPTWIYFVIGLVILVLAVGLILEFRPESLISRSLSKVLKRKE